MSELFKNEMKSSQGSKSAKSRGVRCPGVKYTGGAIFKMMMMTETTPSSLIGFPVMQRVKGPPQAHCVPCNTFGEQREIYEWIRLFFKPP